MRANLFIGFMRTVVPVLAGWVTALAARIGLDLEAAGVALLLEPAVITAYYAVFRLVEAWAGRLRWEPLRKLAGALLGWTRPPKYEDPEEGTR